MKAADLDSLLREFLAGAPRAVAIEDGAIVFDFASAKYSISGEPDRCVLHLWSPERNAVRRVLAADCKADVLKLTVQKFGQPKPTKLEICRNRDRRTPTAKSAARTAYAAQLRRHLERMFFGCTVEKLTTEMDLERSFGPVYTRGLLRQGTTAFAILGVNANEDQSSVDASLTFAVLWLAACRERATKCFVEGIKLFVPAKKSAMVRARLAHLERSAAKWQLYEFNQRDDIIEEVDCTDQGNIETRLVHAPDHDAARSRFAEAITRIHAVVPEADIDIRSSAEIAFRIHGLEIARAELGLSANSFRRDIRITFGTAADETELTDATGAQFDFLAGAVAEHRQAKAARANSLWRMCPERWLESLVKRDVRCIDDRLDPAHVYAQVPAFSASDRAMIDLLTCTRDGRLAVIELKAEEDIHLPLQGVDYWARVRWHQQRCEFHKFGYFAGRELSPEAPLLFLVAPALHVHPSTDTLLRYISPDIEATVVGIDESWRDGVRVVFRKRAEGTRGISNSSF
jgi:hypothetical protein